MTRGISFKDVSFSYSPSGKSRAIADFSAEFEAEKITVLTGVSGCGKSTLLYLAAGIFPANSGALISGCITVDGKNPADLPAHMRCRLVGMMFQNPELQFCMNTVENEMIFCLENIQMPPQNMMQMIDVALSFCGISHLRARTLHSLSGGEKQRVMLACIVALRPAWLLLDEPFANVDDDSAEQIAQSLVKMNRELNTGIVAVDHRLHQWIGVADCLHVIGKKGCFSEKLEIKNVQPEQMAAFGISIPGQAYQSRLEQASDSKELLEIKELTLDLGERRILDGLEYRFHTGQIYAIVGNSGCGKSTLFSVLSGTQRAAGRIIFDNKTFDAGKRKRMNGVAYVAQNPQDQFIAETVYDEVAVGLKNTLTPDALEKEVERVLRGISLWSYRKVSPYRLSQGQQRRLGVAALLALPCRVLICDEPTYAQDRNNTTSIMDTLQHEARENGITLIFSTHDRQLAEDYADVILEMSGGNLHEIN